MMNVSKKLFLAFLAVVFAGMSAFAAPEETKTVIPSTPSSQAGTNNQPVFLNPQETNAGGGSQSSDIPSSAESSNDAGTVILIILAAVGVIAAGAAVVFLFLIKKQTDHVQNGLPMISDQVDYIIKLDIDKKLDGISAKLQSFSPDEELRAALTKAMEAGARFEGELNRKAAELETAERDLETARNELAGKENGLADAMKDSANKDEALTAAKAELETARKDLETARKELTGKENELTQVRNTLSAKETALAQAEESAKTQSETLKKQYDEAIAARDGFYGKDCEDLRRELLETQQVPRESALALAAAWLSLATTRQMLPDRLRSALEVFDATVWGIFGKDDLDRLHAVRRYLLPRVRQLLEGTDFGFTWPEPGTELKALDEKEYRIESGFRAVRYATCGCIRRKGDVVTSSRVVCEDE